MKKYSEQAEGADPRLKRKWAEAQEALTKAIVQCQSVGMSLSEVKEFQALVVLRQVDFIKQVQYNIGVPEDGIPGTVTLHRFNQVHEAIKIKHRSDQELQERSL